MSEYAYENTLIKLNMTDYMKLAELYPHIKSIPEELDKINAELDDPSRTKKPKWWGTMHHRLKVTNEYAARDQRFNRTQTVSDDTYTPNHW